MAVLRKKSLTLYDLTKPLLKISTLRGCSPLDIFQNNYTIGIIIYNDIYYKGTYVDRLTVQLRKYEIYWH